METPCNAISGIDYPRTFQEMDEWFRSDAACREYIRRLRWPDGFLCPECGVAADPWGMSRGRLRCRACEWETSLTAGTVSQDTRKPLRMWFLAMWFVTSQKNGVSALGLQRALGLGSYETAWTWLHSCGGRWSGLVGIVYGDGRSRRNLRRRPGRGQAWSGCRSQDHCRRGRRKERSGHRPDPPSAHQGCVGG